MDLFRGIDRLLRPKTRYAPATRLPFRAGQAVWSDWNIDRAIRQGYKANTWVYRCVTTTMELGSEVPFGWQRLNSQGKWEFDFTHPLSRILGWWNSDFGPEESVSRLLSYLLLGGNALIGTFYSGEELVELRAETPIGVRPIADNVGGIEVYEYSDRGDRKYWNANDICHGRLPDPQNALWGMGRLQAIARAVDTDIEAVGLNKRRLEKGAVPDGILIDRSIRSRQQREDAQAAIDDQWGQIAGPWVQGDGVDWVQLGLSQRDIDWLEGRRFTMLEIVIGFGYHPALFGFTNARVAERSKWTGAILPLLKILAGCLTRRLISRENQGQERIMYDTSGVEALQQDLSGKLQSLERAVSSGMPYDAAKALLQLPTEDLPGAIGKVPLLRGRFTTLRSLVASDDPPAGGSAVG